MSHHKPIQHAFRADILRSSLIGDPCRVMLLHMATVEVVTTKGGHPMTPEGLVKISREELAEALGVKSKDISNRIAEAVRVGLLVKVAGGRNGQTAAYRAHPRGAAKGASYTGPTSLCAFVNAPADVVVGTTGVVPGTGSKGLVGTTGVAPYARAHYLQNDANPQPAPDESREEREHDVTSQAGNYWESPGTRLRRPSSVPRTVAS